VDRTWCMHGYAWPNRCDSLKKKISSLWGSRRIRAPTDEVSKILTYREERKSKLELRNTRLPKLRSRLPKLRSRFKMYTTRERRGEVMLLAAVGATIVMQHVAPACCARISLIDPAINRARSFDRRDQTKWSSNRRVPGANYQSMHAIGRDSQQASNISCGKSGERSSDWGFQVELTRWLPALHWWSRWK